MVDVDVNLADLVKKKGRNVGCGDDDEESGEEAFHFIAYVHVGDSLWELDGLKRQPIKLREPTSILSSGYIRPLTTGVDTCPKDEWLSLVSPSLQERIARYNEGELRFNLLAVVPERQGGPADGVGEGSYEDIAERRKFDYEAFAHKVAMMLEKEQVANLMY